MRQYLVEGRVRGRWVILGDPFVDREAALVAAAAARERGDCEETRVLVINARRVVVKIID